MDPITIAMALSRFAPQIIKWVTGSDKAAQAAGTVVEIAKAVTGKSDGPAALEAIQADPALVLQFRQAMAENEADLDKAYLADVQSARARDLELAKLGQSNTRANWMILGDVIGLLACLAAMVYTTWLGVQGANGSNDVSPIIMALNGPLGMLTQQFANGLRDAHQFEFGSSRGSKEKDEALLRKG